MAEVTVLTCPVCGAPLEPTSDRCSYCGSVIVLKTDHPRIDPRLINKSVIDKHIAEYRRAVRQDQYDETAHYGLGVAYFNLGLYEEAAGELSQAARLMPENPHIQAQLAVVLREAARRGNKDAERRMYTRIETALKLDAHHLEASMLQAELLRESGNFAGAVGTLRETYLFAPDRARPKLVDWLLDWSRELAEKDQWEEVVQRWQELGELDPDRAKQAMVSFLSNHKRSIPKVVTGGASPRSAFDKILGTGAGILAGLIIGFVVFLVLTLVAPTDASDTIAGWGIAMVLLGFLIFVASPFAGGIIMWNRMASMTGADPEKVDREQMLAGQATLPLTTKVVRAVIHQQQLKAAR